MTESHSVVAEAFRLVSATFYVIVEWRSVVAESFRLVSASFYINVEWRSVKSEPFRVNVECRSVELELYRLNVEWQRHTRLHCDSQPLPLVQYLEKQFFHDVAMACAGVVNAFALVVGIAQIAHNAFKFLSIKNGSRFGVILHEVRIYA